MQRQPRWPPDGSGSTGHPRALLSRGSFRAALLLLACASLAAGLAQASQKTVTPTPDGPRRTLSTPTGNPKQAAPPVQHRRRHDRPNIVFVLTDDLSMNLLRFMPHVLAMERHGLTFKDYFVSDSLCCPSRASIFTGNFPHDTHVFGNTGREAGFREFFDRGEENQTFATTLQRAGYRTAMMGKYLNGYLEAPGLTRDGSAANVPPTYVPPGWSRWQVVGYGYREYNYLLNHNGQLAYFGHQPSDYLTDVLGRYGTDFINDSARSGQPFYLELATFAPHFPYTPAPQDVHDFPGLKAPRPPNFDVLPTDPPKWLSGHRRLTLGQIRVINRAFRRRAQAVQAVDRMIGEIEGTLARDGLSRNTYLVFSSDNGLHTGEYRLLPGKLTAFDTDIHVPLIVVGPRVPAGAKTAAMAENIDLAKTFSAIAGTSMPGDGHSLLSLLHGAHPAKWRNAVLIEHHGRKIDVTDPDFQRPGSGDPTTYEAMRTHGFLYVEYSDGERELYNLRLDPFELHNIAGLAPSGLLAQFHSDLLAMENCHNGRSCWAALHIPRLRSAAHFRHRHPNRRP